MHIDMLIIKRHILDKKTTLMTVKQHMLNRHLVPSENRLAEFDSATMVPAKFRAYVEARAKERPVLSDFYTNTMTTPGHTQYTIFKRTPNGISKRM
ncbi:hypothetical protein GGI03_007830, partial [Coemansia sp. RSA 2337]